MPEVLQSPFSGAIGTTGMRGSEYFPDPFADYASTVMPHSIQNVLRWCEFIFMRNGIYREALRRKLAYFITDVEIREVKGGREEKDKYKTYLNEKLDLPNVLTYTGTDYACYGNSFSYLWFPFRRYLSCPKCHTEFPLATVYNTKATFHFSWSNFEFHATCPVCAVGSGYTGVWNHIDRRGGEESEIKVVRRSPHEMEILYDYLTHETAYIWKIPEDYRRDVREGKLFMLERASWEVVQAIKNNNAFQFAPGVIYHMRDETLSGIRNRGWGISQLITNFSMAWYVQVLHRYNEAIALDYVIPFRVITPAAHPGGSDAASTDPLVGLNNNSFMNRCRAMLRNRRRDPAAWNIMPFPIDYKALGGEATQMAPKELLDQGIDNLLNASGVPVDFYKGTLTIQNTAPALRIFQITNSPLVHNLNGFVRWLVRGLGERLGWEPVTGCLSKTTHADDIEERMAKLQLMMGRQISQTTGMRSMGLNFQDEQRALLEEEQFVAEETQKIQEQMGRQQAGQQALAAAAPGGSGGGAAPAGDPNAGGGAAPAAAPSTAGGGPTAPVSPQELIAKAEQISSELRKMPDSQRKSELIAIKKVDPTLHALVKSQLEDSKRQDEREGGQQIQAQRQQGPPSGQKTALAGAFQGVMDRFPAARPGRGIEID